MTAFELLKKDVPEFANAFNDLVESFIRKNGLKKENLHSISIAMNSSTSNSLSIQLHVPKSKKISGARENILDTILVTMTAI